MRPQQRHLWRFVLFAFLLNALLPFFAVYNTTHLSASSAKNALFGDRILICTGDGFRWIERSDAGKQKPHNGTHYECALCFFAAHGLEKIALFAGILLAYALRVTMAQRIAANIAAYRIYRPQFRHSRAPPVLSL